MKKSEFVRVFKENCPVELTNNEARVITNSFLETLENGLKEEGMVSVTPFGKFVVVERAARKGRNPQTGEEIEISARNVVRFKPSKNLKESI